MTSSEERPGRVVLCTFPPDSSARQVGVVLSALMAESNQLGARIRGLPDGSVEVSTVDHRPRKKQDDDA